MLISRSTDIPASIWRGARASGVPHRRLAFTRAAPFSHTKGSVTPSSPQKCSISRRVLLEFGMMATPRSRNDRMSSRITANPKSSWPSNVPSRSVMKMVGTLLVSRLLNVWLSANQTPSNIRKVKCLNLHGDDAIFAAVWRVGPFCLLPSPVLTFCAAISCALGWRAPVVGLQGVARAEGCLRERVVHHLRRCA